MSDSKADAMNDLQQLLGGLVSSSPAPSEAAAPETEPGDSGGMDEFGTLQELLVKPEILAMRGHLAKIEEELPQVRQMQGRLEHLEGVLPEWEAVKNRVNRLEATVPVVQQQLQQIEQTQTPAAIAQALLPLLSEQLDHKFAQLEERLEEAIAALPRGAMPTEDLSLQVWAIDPDDRSA
ncbi:MAG: hypothetical protein ACPGVO_05635 [Spirulinaceae cyanobacterium]